MFRPLRWKSDPGYLNSSISRLLLLASFLPRLPHSHSHTSILFVLLSSSVSSQVKTSISLGFTFFMFLTRSKDYNVICKQSHHPRSKIWEDCKESNIGVDVVLIANICHVLRYFKIFLTLEQFLNHISDHEKHKTLHWRKIQKSSLFLNCLSKPNYCY